MDIMDVCDRLLYDKEKFIIYLDYRNKVEDTIYLSFEEFLLCENNLEEYIQDENRILQKYRTYHEDSDIKDYECFEQFCKSFNINPYDTQKLNEFKSCKNCIYYGHTVNLITGDEYDDCTMDELFSYNDSCDFHVFDVNKVKPIIRTLSR